MSNKQGDFLRSILILSICLLFFTLSACSEREETYNDLNEDLTISDDYNQRIKFFQELQNGNHLLIGETYREDYSDSDVDIYFTDGDFNVLWRRTIDGFLSENIVSFSVQGDVIYIFGNTNSEGNVLGQSKGGYDTFIASYDKDGNQLLNIRYGGPGSDSFLAVSKDSNNDFYALIHSDSDSGDFTLKSNNDRFLIVKLNKYGELINQTVLDNNLVYSNLKINSNDQLILIGRVNNGSYYSINGNQLNNYDSFFSAYDKDGNELYSRQLVDYNNLIINDYDFDSKDNILFTGTFMESITEYKLLISKLDIRFESIWENITKNNSNSFFNYLDVLSNDTILVGGYLDYLYPNGSSIPQSGIVLRLDGSGNFVAQRQFVSEAHFTRVFSRSSGYTITTSIKNLKNDYDIFILTTDLNFRPIGDMGINLIISP